MTDVSLQSKLFAQLSWPKGLSPGLDMPWESALAFSLVFAALPVFPGCTALAYSRRAPLIEHATVSLQRTSVMLSDTLTALGNSCTRREDIRLVGEVCN